ncbi:MAG: RNA polymerase subunit sigma-70 [Bacteroidales bacterium]|nr:RNA polymerase subunit sigma-70 [Bacteroidales bacterium]
MVKATISADIVSSTSLSVEELSLLQSKIRWFLEGLSEKSQGKNWGRLFKGDSVEIFLFDPHEALRVALLLKTLVKKTFSWGKETNARRELFKKYGVRLAIGIGEMRTADRQQDIMDGEAIYFSGRLLEKATKEKATLKRSMLFGSSNPLLTEEINMMLGMLDVMLRNATSRQNEILYHKLLGHNEEEIAKELKIRQSVVNQHSSSIGWNAIESAVTYFEKLNFEQ